MARKAARLAVEKRPFAKKILGLSGCRSVWNVWTDFITMFACALSNRVDRAHFEAREAMYKRLASKYSETEQAVFPDLVADVVDAFEKNPEQDFLGSVFMELELGNEHAGQFFTPYEVCELMSRLSCTGIASRVIDRGYVTINDCACGAGATLIAACMEAQKQLELFGLNWQKHILIAAQDIDYVVGMMCYIQLSLIGAAGFVKIADAIATPITCADNDENYWYTPMYFSDVWTMRRIWHSMDSLFRTGA